MGKYTNENHLFTFRINLLRTVVLLSSVFSTFFATLFSMGILPLATAYMFMLYGYGVINLGIYFLLKYQSQYYFLLINILLISSLATFIVMTKTVLHDEFKLVWFFLTSFGAFILGGKYYGFMVTCLILTIVISLYSFYDINLSFYALFTFSIALILFNTFAFFFLKKIENDSMYLEKRVLEEVEKRQVHEQILLRQYRMANMGEMIDAIAHQWRQPLMQNSMMILNLYDAVESDEFNKNYVLGKLEKLSQVNSHLSKTIEDFRNLLKSDKEILSFNLDEMFREIFSLMSSSLQEVNVEYRSNDLTILALKGELIQVLIILIFNSLELFNQKNINDKRLIVNAYRRGEYVEVTIEDNAGGINELIIDKIFDPYFTTKQDKGGSGLGLYIAKIIIEENMSGSLTVTNTEIGAKFKIKLLGEKNASREEI